MCELQEREAAYRERLAQQHHLYEKLRTCSEALQHLLHERPPNETNLLQTLHAIALVTSQTLGIKRSSVWMMDPRGKALRCRILLVDGVQQPSEHVSLSCVDSPVYCEALRSGEPVAVTDALHDPRTSELRDYLLENDVGALLDIAVLARNEAIGVVCLEHVGGTRSWWPAEVAFASHLGALVALGVEAERRVRAEYAAKEAEARYRHLVESLPVVVYSMDADRKRLRYVSPRVNELGNLDAEQWLKLGPEAWLERVVDEDRPRVIDRLRKGIPRGISDELVYRVRIEGRGIRWIRDTCTLIRDANGDPFAVQGMLADITALREAELEKQESQRRARTLLENIAMLAVQIDSHGMIIKVNPYFSQVTGYERESLAGTSWYDYLASREEAARLRASYEAALRVGSISPRSEYSLRTKSGEIRRFLWTRTVLKDTTGRSNGIITLGMDLTDRMRLEAEGTQRAKAQSLGHLASAVAHDFNNLLTVIINQTALLSRLATGERAERAKASLDSAITQATELTQSLLVYARKNPEQKQLTDVDDLLHELTPLLHAMVGKRVHLTTQFNAESSQVWMDRTRLRQIVLNLVGNASQATAGQGSSIRVSTHVEFIEADRALRNGGQGEGEYVVVSVEDDGHGMDAQTLDRMFEPFFTTKSEGHGTGLGLAICQSIVGDVRGFIEAKSKVDDGTSLSIFLPRKSAAAARIRPAPVQSGVVRAPKVLLVFGPTLDTGLAVSIREAGYAVALAGSVKEAMTHMGTGPIDVLVLDTELTHDVLALPVSARAVHPDLHVVGIEGNGASPAISEECDFHVRRPVDARSLITAIDEAFRAEQIPPRTSFDG